MINSFSIENFRSLKKMEIEGMERLTLISGRNNVGKSTFLEAIFMFLDHNSPDSFQTMCSLRGATGSGASLLWEPLFYALNTDNVIKIKAKSDCQHSELIYQKDENYLPYNLSGISEEMLAQFRSALQKSYSLTYRYDETDKTVYHEEGHFAINNNVVLREFKTNLPGNEIRPSVSCQYLNATVCRLSDNVLTGIGQLELKGEKDKIIQVLKMIDPGIEDIITLSIQGVTQLYLKEGTQLIPLQYAGDGIMKLLNICIAVMENKNGIVLIDEMEAGLHYSIYGRLWKVLAQISREENCQVIATTHSYELISAVSGNLPDPQEFVYYRLGKENDSVRAYRYTYSMLGQALNSELEVR